MNVFFLGTLCALHAVTAGFFLKFWHVTGDRLFAMFAAAFAVFAFNQVAFLLWGENEVQTNLYVVRLAAFLLILLAIVDKNRR